MSHGENPLLFAQVCGMRRCRLADLSQLSRELIRDGETNVCTRRDCRLRPAFLQGVSLDNCTPPDSRRLFLMLCWTPAGARTATEKCGGNWVPLGAKVNRSAPKDRSWRAFTRPRSLREGLGVLPPQPSAPRTPVPRPILRKNGDGK